MKIVRSILAILAGTGAMFAFVEGIEYLLVVIISGADSADSEKYFAVRNQTGIITTKHFYNLMGGFIGGWVTCKIARYRLKTHGLVLMGLQVLSFIYAMTDPVMKTFAPQWAWISFGIVTLTGIWLGTNQVIRKQRLSIRTI